MAFKAEDPSPISPTIIDFLVSIITIFAEVYKMFGLY